MCTLGTQTVTAWVADEQTRFTKDIEVQTTATDDIIEIEIVEVDDVIISQTKGSGGTAST